MYPVHPGTYETVEFAPTPSQTVGPYWSIGLYIGDGGEVVPEDAEGALLIELTVLDGAGDPIADVLLETWQADAAGRFNHPDDPRGAAEPTPPGFRGFGRIIVDQHGTGLVRTVKPGALPAEDGLVEAPHIDLGVFARGMLERLFTRIYFPDEAAANAADPVLASLPESERGKIIATKTDTGYKMTIYVQDDRGRETPFFAI
ncbi:protocatechuate 3,4-dioxygenase subunit alpha [Tsukamurella soli]|uniref:protocatechuate 3,4-dioxygenase subunit alpha n=1 Tax=Tsukamurella soli TaxID=644556 RepID=UPI00360A4405